MPRLSLLDLPYPEQSYRVDLAPPCQRTGQCFEKVANARREDLTRAVLISKACRHTDVPFDRNAALALARRLKKSGRGESECETMASMVYVGRKRFRIFGALWKLIDDQ